MVATSERRAHTALSMEDWAWAGSWGLVSVVIIGAALLAPLTLPVVGVLVTASLSLTATLATTMVTRQSNRRLAQEYEDEQRRLRLDAAMRAGSLFTPNDSVPAAPATVASGLLALTKLDHVELAVALLVDLWDDSGRGKVSDETAILVIDAALRSTQPNAQLVGAELLCRNAARLDSCQSLHWPSSLDGNWDPRFGPKTKFLLLDALVSMTKAREVDHNSLRSVAVRLYGIWVKEDDEHVRGCVGTLVEAVLPELRALGYKDLLQGSQRVMLEEFTKAADSAAPNPDLFLSKVTARRASDLSAWAAGCKRFRLEPGRLADASADFVKLGGL